MKNFIPESIVPNIIECFFDVKKGGYYMFALLKLSIMDWDSLKRWSSVDLALLKPD